MPMTSTVVNNQEILVVYANDVAYIGTVDVKELANAASGVAVRNPFVLNVRPVQSKQEEGKLEAVVIDIMLPIELGGVALSEQLYTGFVNFTSSSIELPSGKSSVVMLDGGQKVSINRLSAIADRNDPVIWLYGIDKVVIPSDDIVSIYMSKVTNYKSLLYSTRMVELQALQEEAQSGTGNTQGQVVNIETDSVH
jgi:hypothetical protein